MGIIGDFFGGTDDSAQDFTKNQNKRNTEYIKDQADQARTDVLSLWPTGDQSRNAGYQSAYDILMSMISPQIQAMKKGNVGAQNLLLAGLPQMQNAILGNPIDYGGLQAQNLPAETGWANQGTGIQGIVPPPDYAQNSWPQNPLAGTGN